MTLTTALDGHQCGSERHQAITHAGAVSRNLENRT